MATFEEIEQQREFQEQQAAREKQRAAAVQQQVEQQKQQAERLRARVRAIAFSDVSATPDEMSRVDNLLRQNKPEQFGNPDAIKTMVLTIRALTGVSTRTGGIL